jgi:glycine/D-amino acid oxidase-like deaminating enzyme
MNRTAPDVIVIGGGNIGSATAFGLAKLSVAVALIDEGDMALKGVVLCTPASAGSRFGHPPWRRYWG